MYQEKYEENKKVLKKEIKTIFVESSSVEEAYKKAKELEVKNEILNSLKLDEENYSLINTQYNTMVDEIYSRCKKRGIENVDELDEVFINIEEEKEDISNNEANNKIVKRKIDRLVFRIKTSIFFLIVACLVGINFSDNYFQIAPNRMNSFSIIVSFFMLINGYYLLLCILDYKEIKGMKKNCELPKKLKIMLSILVISLIIFISLFLVCLGNIFRLA